MKQFATTLLLVLVPLVASAQLSVGVMNPDSVLNAMPEATEVQAELQEYVNERQQTFQERYQDWINQVTEYSEAVEAGNYTEQQQLEEEERLATIQEELNALESRIQSQIQEKQSELFNPLLLQVEEAMAEVAEEMGLDYVLNRRSSMGDPIVYYSSSRAPDITQQVIDKLTQN
ncbi:MAG: hypothetical protein GVY02_01390 [Bacteroidetes bacterium]|jgi:outer membrane protein|nr:hypothetical protein [Bacteroidota bacterium]